MCNMGVDPSEVEVAMNDEVERMKREPISERELQKLKNQIEYGFVTGNQSMAGIAESLANYHTYFGDANLINTEIERYLAITPEDIQSAPELLCARQRVTSTCTTPTHSHDLNSNTFLRHASLFVLACAVGASWANWTEARPQKLGQRLS